MPEAAPTPIRAVIFDLGGVVVGQPRWTEAFWAGRLMHVNPLTVALRLPSAMGLVVAGEADEEDILSAFARVHGGALPANWRSLAAQRYRSTVPVHEDVLDFVKQLQQRGIATPLLSNTIPLHAEVDRARGIHQLFSPIFLSYEVGRKKPDLSIFVHALDVLMLPANACVFVDDRQENIDAARKVGMHALLFSGLSRLKDELLPFGIGGQQRPSPFLP